MEKITAENCISTLLENFPLVQPLWKAYLKEWGEGCGLYNEIDPFLDYLIDNLKEKNWDEIEKFFYLLEVMLCKGDEFIKTLTATGFLEGLLGMAVNQGLDFTEFSKYMGKNSVEYCEAWDKFCGVKTEGLVYHPLSFKYEWEEDFEVEIRIEKDTVLINANKAGLISLAHQLLNLAHEEIKEGDVLEYNEKNSLEEGSNRLVIQKKSSDG